MKRIAILALAILMFTGCAQTLHKPTTAGNAGTSALVAYAIAGYTAGQYLGLPLCAATPVYPCKTQAINDKVVAADLAAYTAAVAADQAGNAAAAAGQINALKGVNASTEVKTQVDLKAKMGEQK